MIITNKSVKIVGIDGRYLMPDESVTVSAKIAEAPAVKALASLGIIAIELEESEKTPVKTEEEIRQEIIAEERARIEAEIRAEYEAKEREKAYVGPEQSDEADPDAEPDFAGSDEVKAEPKKTRKTAKTEKAE